MSTQLTWRQTLVLEAIDHLVTPSTAGEIAEALNAPPSSVRAALKSLAQRGLVATKGVAFSGASTWARVEATP